MMPCYWIVTYEEKFKAGKPLLDAQNRPKIDSVTIGPFFEEERLRAFVDKNVHLKYKLFKCDERARDKATRKIREGKAEEI